MNVFLTDPDPKVCAQALDDVRVSKMLVETAQLLCTSLRHFHGVDHPDLYKPTHTAHPCSKWAARARGNFNWLVEHGLHLATEYEFRTDHRRRHKSEGVVLLCADLRDAIPDGPLDLDPAKGGFNSSEFVVTPDLDVFQAYRLTMISKWRYKDPLTLKNRLKWTYRGAPHWKRELWGVNLNDYEHR
jgi:hypothetical protein